MSQVLGQGFLVTQGCIERSGPKRPINEYPFECYVVPVTEPEKLTILFEFPLCSGKLFKVVGFGSKKPAYVFRSDGTKDQEINRLFVCEHCGHFVE